MRNFYPHPFYPEREVAPSLNFMIILHIMLKQKGKA